MFTHKKDTESTFASSSRRSSFVLIRIQSHLSFAAAFPFYWLQQPRRLPLPIFATSQISP